MPSAKLKVYAIWFNMMTSDRREEWPSKLLTDRRVTHFWDDKKLLGNWYAMSKEFSKGSGKVVWDAFFVYRFDSRVDRSAVRFDRLGAALLLATRIS